MKKLDQVIGKIEELIAIVAFSLMTTVTVIAVFFRYVLNSPIIWSEEISRYFAIWGIMFGISIATRHAAHLGVDVIVDFAPKEKQKILIIIGNSILVLTFAFLTVWAISFVVGAFKLGNVSPILRIPFWIIYLALPLGFGLSTLRGIQFIHSTLYGKETKEEVYI